MDGLAVGPNQNAPANQEVKERCPVCNIEMDGKEIDDHLMGHVLEQEDNDANRNNSGGDSPAEQESSEERAQDQQQSQPPQMPFFAQSQAYQRNQQAMARQQAQVNINIGPYNQMQQ